jgi:hypothetical protein
VRDCPVTKAGSAGSPLRALRAEISQGTETAGFRHRRSSFPVVAWFLTARCITRRPSTSRERPTGSAAKRQRSRVSRPL